MDRRFHVIKAGSRHWSAPIEVFFVGGTGHAGKKR
jgi:hypothetical protein